MSGRITLEDQIRRTIGYCCTKLVKGKAQYKVDYETGWEGWVDHPFYPSKEDLETICLLKAFAPKARTKLEEIWRNPDPENGGVRGVSKFVSVVCTNTFRDEHRRLSVRSPELLGVELDKPVEPQEDDDPDAPPRLTDVWSDDLSAESQSFECSDLKDVLPPNEYLLVVEYSAGDTVREIAEKSGTSKSAVERAVQRAREKVKSWREEQKTKPRPYLTPLIWRGRTLRPDRISTENLEHWLDSFKVVPFIVCPHVGHPDDMYQSFDFGGVPLNGHYALCRACWVVYLGSLTEHLGQDLASEALAVGIPNKRKSSETWDKTARSNVIY